MNSSTDNANPRLMTLLPQSIVARTTLCILGLSMLMGLLFAAVAAWRVDMREHRRADAHVAELLSTVESTARIACFLKDPTLAKEIVQGLLGNKAVANVRIAVGTTTLYEQSRPALLPTDASEVETISRKIYSPFDGADQVGEIFLRQNTPEIHAQVHRYALDAALLLGLQVAFVAAGVASVVFGFITRPICGISDELHKLQLRAGARLRIPTYNRADEIGRLVEDVNTLIAGLTETLGFDRVVRLEQLATHDALTGLFNRHGLDNSLAPLFVRRAPDLLQNVALLQIDLDYFKQVNDTYGHEAGDRVLQHVAQVLERSVRRGDLLARPGGDEFVIVLIGVEGPAKALQIANQIIAVVGKPIDIGGGRRARVGASVGIAFAAGLTDTPQALLRRADAAMYAAKQAGRERACLAA